MKVHRDSNSQNGSSFGSVRVHSLTLFCTPKTMKCDSQASLLARTLTSPCLGCEPKVRVTIAHSRKIELVDVQLQLDPTNERIHNILFESQGKLAECFQTLVECCNHHSATRWLRYRDTCSKTFFDFHRINKKKTLLKELEVDSRTISRQEDLSHHISKFYANLYTSEPHSLATAKAQRRC